jgi:hypothetical protein
MKTPIRFRIHINEPFDFERENGSDDLYGTTVDHEGQDSDEWIIELENWFRFNEADYDVVMVSPRYVGEHMSRVFDSILGEPIRIAHRTPEGWHFALAGILSLAPLPPEEADDTEDHGFDEDSK